ncbi:ABC transporter permease [Nocardioides dongxiaopingii]|uniref:ABC transporter permease n=1 Tax=Nocardioides dongxiaopingii TaxID=2576036 RepID=UPI0010C76FFD|nr:FtsX-like permease family protein [Nocardioides dongxiaopingii]
MIRAALKSLLGRKLRLVMSTFAIVLGVAFVVGTLIFSDTLNRSFTSLFASTVGDVVVRPEGGGDAPGGALSTRTVPGDLADTLAEVPGAARADGMVNALGVYVVDDEGKPIGGFGPPSLGASWSDAPAGNGLEGLQIAEGRAPEGPDEVVLDAATAEKSGYDVGDTVPLITTDETANLAPTLVGIADFAEGGSLNGATYAAFETSEAQRLFHGGADEYESIWVTAADGVTQEQLLTDVEAALPDGYEAVTGDEAADESASDLLEAISFLTTFLLIFAGIALVVGSFIIVNTFSILVAQRSRELALLRALGASKRQVVRSVQLEAFVLGFLGATLGVLLGIVLAIGLRALFATFGLDLSGQPLVYRPRSFLAAYVVGILVTMAAAYLPARRTSRIAPVQAMRDDVALPEASLRNRFRYGLLLALVGGALLAAGLTDVLGIGYTGWLVGGGVLAVLLGVTAMAPVLAGPFLRAARALFARLFGSIGNLAGQNSLRNPRRTAATASALMIGLTLACTMAIVGDSAKASVDQTIEESFTGDFVVSSIFGGSFSATVAERVDGVEGVDAVVRQRSGFAEADGDFTVVVATDPDSLERLGVTFVEGGPADLTTGTVLLGDSYAAERGLAVGDDYELDTAGGPVTWTVAGTVETGALLAGGAIVSIPTYEAAGYPAEDSLLVVYADDAASGLQERLDEVLADQPIVTAKDQAAFAAEQREPIDQFVLIIYALLGLALLIAVLGIVNTLALSVIERTREVGLLRAIGVTRAQLRLMITLESVVIAVLGAVLGLVLGTGFGVALMRAVRDEGLEVISVPFGQLGVFLLLAVVVGVLAAVLPARRAARLDVLEAISTE